ncbi:3-deoxy-7-phosphoheptulonate synthase [Candidatus Bathyarchaeota archaeon]|nr:3-deoxy-7-phosphoheptulonate synthase [Candidatus Bathyarchaeota archaeon]
MSVIKVSDKIRLASKQSPDHSTTVHVRNIAFGGERVVVIAGPCSVESRDQLLETARIVKDAGCHMLRGGAYKPRTLPYSFQGLGEEGLRILAEARDVTGLPVVTEVVDPGDVGLVEGYADVLQIGARNMQNYPLLKRVGRAEKPVLLKRGMSATILEWLGCAEYILAEGNPDVILCERGLRGFQKVTRNTLDVAAVPVIHQASHLPVVIDPSHGTGVRSLVKPMAKAGVAAGADGLMLEVHPRPEEALSDGAQSLRPHDLVELVAEVRAVAEAVGRRL